MNEQRECDGCTMCCFQCPVAALKKPAKTRCEHQEEGGCSIYDSRPHDCQQFACSWLEGRLPVELKPNECGVMFETFWLDVPERLGFPENKLYMIMGVGGEPSKEVQDQIEAAAKPGMVIIAGEYYFAQGPQEIEIAAGFLANCRRNGGVNVVTPDSNGFLELKE